MKLFKKMLSKKNKGTTLVELMIGVGIIGIGVATSVQQTGNMNSQFLRTKSLFSYHSTVSEIIGILSQYPLTEESFLKNSAIVPCVGFKDNTEDCQDKSSGNWTPFNLLRPNTNIIVAGTPSSPVSYDSKGEVCSRNCSYRAFTEVKPICLKGNICKVAHTLIVKYTVEPITNAKIWGSDALAPRRVVFETTLETNLVPLVDEIRTISCDLSKNSREVLIGVSFNLEAICKDFIPAVEGDRGFTGDTGDQGDAGSNGGNAC